MINEPRRDPIDPRVDPRDPATDPRLGYTDPRSEPTVINNSSGGSRAGIALAAIVAALLVIGFIAFTGSNGNVDTMPTASTDTNSQTVAPSSDTTAAQPKPATPAAPQDNAPAAAPQTDNAPAADQ